MKIIQLYRIINEQGQTTVTPNQPESGEYFTDRYRLVADEGKALQHNGIYVGMMTDTDTLEEWTEIEDPHKDARNNKGEH